MLLAILSVPLLLVETHALRLARIVDTPEQAVRHVMFGGRPSISHNYPEPVLGFNAMDFETR